MSKEIRLNKLIADKIEEQKIDDTIKSFLIEILSLERGMLNLEGRITYSDQYKRLIEKYVTKEDSSK